MSAKRVENAKKFRDEMFRSHLWWTVLYGEGDSFARYFDVATTMAHERYLAACYAATGKRMREPDGMPA